METPVPAWSSTEGEPPDIPVEILTTAGRESNGSVHQERWRSARRVRTAAKTMLLFLALAAVSVFIPGLHFFLVPGFLLAAFVGGGIAFSRGTTVAAKNVPCPNCGQMALFERENPKWPLHVHCEHCDAEMSIRVRAS
ncbi:MAG: hypothetical protein KDD44_07780 [Bdellovibrionales bacterium]|nr:hypothetical protein [Bdellovibrionales bacterium]